MPKFLLIMGRCAGKTFVYELVREELEKNLPPRPERVPEYLRPMYKALRQQVGKS